MVLVWFYGAKLLYQLECASSFWVSAVLLGPFILFMSIFRAIYRTR